MRIVFTVALAALLVACSSGQPAPAPARPYSPTTQQPTTYAPQAYQAPQPTYAPAAGPFRWYTRLGEAQSAARAQNKLILVGSTKPGCTLCDKFKNEIVPQAGGRVSSVAVGYMVHAITPEAPQIWAALKANLPRAGLMPLVGIFTPDLRYLTGFGGPADSQQLMSAISTARRLYPVSARPPVRPMVRSNATAQVNEYGEYEWTPLPATWARTAPRDALTADVRSPAAPALPPAPQPVATPIATSAPVVAVAAAPVAPRNRTPAEWSSVATSKPAAAKPPHPPFHREPEPALESWAEQALRQALADIRAGDLDRAKSRLAEIHARMPGSTLAREAAKGSVAIYNTARIQDASGGERERLRAAAERNLGHSMWGELFRS